ncbi:SOS response-associated peptidase [Neolewinella lacunae]|uniref:Abasic site processing protein n=1 Tax=Neolewinella lacunae TaxID=1517758 RepID=A0A923T8P6_9BACT|nr:SOS response-associated peptidase [Neolewinella lacunae]MBC6995860.1 SOS response-associated peptidase [Neolewinella lacunae]MDN3636447.1 SOS response-associated peptidase [Neolewinella lacunae]
MCGRYSIVIDEAKLRQQFGNELKFPPAGLPTNYNVAPTQQGLVLTDRDPQQLQLFRWGLVPFWAKDLSIGARMINARREGIEDKPSFRQAIRQRRCLVLADSFYEWQRVGKAKTPHRILPADGQLLVMAGIWEQWRPPDDPEHPIHTFSIITGDPNAEMDAIHDRMPMLLYTPQSQARWLDPATSLDGVLDLLHTPPGGMLHHYAVSPLVGNVRNNGPELHAAQVA